MQTWGSRRQSVPLVPLPLPWRKEALPNLCFRGMKSRIRGPAGPLGLAVLRGSGGKSPKRRQWRIKRGDFEEAARLAATNSGRESYRRDGGQDFGIPPGFSFGVWGTCSFQKRKPPTSPDAIGNGALPCLWEKAPLSFLAGAETGKIHESCSKSAKNPKDFRQNDEVACPPLKSNPGAKNRLL